MKHLTLPLCPWLGAHGGVRSVMGDVAQGLRRRAPHLAANASGVQLDKHTGRAGSSAAEESQNVRLYHISSHVSGIGNGAFAHPICTHCFSSEPYLLGIQHQFEYNTGNTTPKASPPRPRMPTDHDSAMKEIQFASRGRQKATAPLSPCPRARTPGPPPPAPRRIRSGLAVG